MKSLCVKLGVILIGLTIFSNAEVWGADWKFLKVWGIPEEWEKNYPDLKDLAGAFLCYDASSIVYPSRNIVKVWVRIFLADKEPIPSSISSEVKDLPVCKASEVMKLPYADLLYEIDCRKRTYKTIMQNVAKPKEGFYKENKEISDSKEISPDIDVDIVWKIVCK